MLLNLSIFFALVSNFVLAQSDATSAVVVTAQPTSTPSITSPSCATACIQNATRAQSCEETDTECLCRNASAIQDAVSSCLTVSSACTEAERTTAIAFYPQTCAILGYSTGSASSASVSILVASGSAPAKASHGTASSLVLTATRGSTVETTITGYDEEDSHPLKLPAILGITLAVALLVVGVAVVTVWACLRRCQSRRDLEAESNTPAIRPKRSQSVRSSFLTQPSPIEKDFGHGFGDSLSRSSTIVGRPPTAVAKLDKPLPEIKVSARDFDDSFEKFQEQERARNPVHHGSPEVEDHTRTSRSTISMMLESLSTINKSKEYDASNKI